ncbi:holin lysis mediator [Serratia phage X20]|uniref:Holin n=1 Tax=Serratia phage X20 TaxID=2006942 RepID=A0A1Z1LZF9_9CAUD|nr:holin [Serratia phage X20]ARW58231.1 holin lysis mediator [Serratia phage X20]
MTTPRTPIPIVDILFGVLDRLFKDNATGRVLASRVLTVVILFILCLIWYKGDTFMETYKQSRYETYAKVLQQDRDVKFDSSALEQLQIVHVSSGADFSAVYSFRPKNLNYFVDLVAYEGRLPISVNEKNLGGYPVDKTSGEYSTHLSGAAFSSNNEFIFLPTKKKDTELQYMFSCPYFNLDNVYSGTVSMYWYQPPILSETRLNAICQQAARTLGRAR